MDTIRDSDVYEREEAVRKILIKQINTLKDCKSLNPFIMLEFLAIRIEARDAE